VGILLLLSFPGHATDIFPYVAFQFEDSTAQQIVVPCRMRSNFMIISATINQQGPFNFLLDTGSFNSLILDPKVARLVGLQAERPLPGRGLGSNKPTAAYLAKPAQVAFAGIEAARLSFFVLAKKPVGVSWLMGKPVHGILGYDLFSSFVVRVQPGTGQLIFSTPTRPPLSEGSEWATLPMTIWDGKPHVNATLALTDTLTQLVTLMVDTGAGHALSLEQIPGPWLHLLESTTKVALGRGLSGTVTGSLARIYGLQLGFYRLRSVETSFPDSSQRAGRTRPPRQGTLGFEALRRFDLVIDYPHNQLRLRPNSQRRASSRPKIQNMRTSFVLSHPSIHHLASRAS
jgi:hypothetical protein